MPLIWINPVVDKMYEPKDLEEFYNKYPEIIDKLMMAKVTPRH